MSLAGNNKHIKLALALAFATAAVGCTQEMDSVTESGTQEEEALNSINGLASLNGLNSTNGLTSANGLNSINGLTSVNGISSLNGLNSTNGLSSTVGLMTTAGGRTAVSYVVRCALASSKTLTKKDQNGVSYSFKGQFGLAPEWETGACGTSCQEAVSACIMAHVNSNGVHVPLWFDSPMSQIGFGRSADYPNQEGTFFGNLFVTGSDGKVPAFYCEGPGFAKGVVPGRLGAADSTIFRNPFGDGGLCAEKCAAAPSGAVGDGYSSCNGYTRPITVWRQASYRPDFDTTYRYKLINTASKKALDIKGWNTSEGGDVEQYSYNAGNNQLFQIVLVASSTWKLVAVSSGKVIAGTGTSSGAAVKQYNYVDSDAHEWGIDDHNGHFKLTNKASKNALQMPSGNNSDGTLAQTAPWAGTSNQDWDIVAVSVQ